MSLNNAEKTQHKDDSQSNSIAAGEVSEDVDATAAVAGGREEDTDGSNNTLSQNSSTQLHPSEKEKMGIISGFCAVTLFETKKYRPIIEFISIIKKVDFINVLFVILPTGCAQRIRRCLNYSGDLSFFSLRSGDTLICTDVVNCGVEESTSTPNFTPNRCRGHGGVRLQN